jgi:hypothetical protein
VDAEAKVFYPKAKIKVSGADKLTAQAREASAAAVGRARDATSAAALIAAQRATQRVQTAQTAAEAASKSVRKGVFSARGRAAPWLESAADYTTDTVAPRVSSVLRDTARQIGPPDRRQKGFRPALRWSLLATAAFAAAGAAALLARQRYRAGMAAADTEDAGAHAQPTSAPGAEPMTPAGSAPGDGPADAGVNGKVSASG